MSKFTALSTIEHDGKRYNPGDAVELDDEQAALLLALVPPAIEHLPDAAAPAAEPKPAAKPKQGKAG